MKTRRIGSLVAIALCLASAVGVARATESKKKNSPTRLDSAPLVPAADGWYDATPPDKSFEVRIPGPFQGFAEEGKTEAGVPSHTVGVRANLAAAFGGQTSYVASCIQQKDDQRTPKQRLQAGIDRWEKLGMIRSREVLETGPDPGFEFEIADDVKVIRSRIYATPTRTCTVLVSWRPYAKPSEADLEKYLRSFVSKR